MKILYKVLPALLIPTIAVGTYYSFKPSAVSYQTQPASNTVIKTDNTQQSLQPTTTQEVVQQPLLDTQPTTQVKTEKNIETPYYGEDPNQAGVYKVFDKQKLLNDVGIDIENQVWATRILDSMLDGSWIYNIRVDNVDGHVTLLYPKVSSETVSVAGDDYKLNPITQVKWLKNYVETKYNNNWQQAYLNI